MRYLHTANAALRAGKPETPYCGMPCGGGFCGLNGAIRVVVLTALEKGREAYCIYDEDTCMSYDGYVRVMQAGLGAQCSGSCPIQILKLSIAYPSLCLPVMHSARLPCHLPLSTWEKALFSLFNFWLESCYRGLAPCWAPQGCTHQPTCPHSPPLQ